MEKRRFIADLVASVESTKTATVVTAASKLAITVTAITAIKSAASIHLRKGD